MGDRGNKLRQIFGDGSFGMEELPGRPIVELAGDRRVLIENHQGILVCGRERIAVKVSYGEVWIQGQDLEILVMGAEQLVIRGKVERLCLKRRKTP